MSLEESRNADESLKRLRLIRGGNRATVTRLEREATSFIQENGWLSSADANEIFVKLTTTVKTLKGKQEYLSKLGDQILEKCACEEINGEVEESTDINAKITMIIEKIEDFIKKNQGRQDIPRVREYSSTPTREYGF